MSGGRYFFTPPPLNDGEIAPMPVKLRSSGLSGALEHPPRPTDAKGPRSHRIVSQGKVSGRCLSGRHFDECHVVSCACTCHPRP